MNTTKAATMLAALLLFIFAVVEVLTLTQTTVVAEAEAATGTPVANLGVTKFATHPQASKLGFNYSSINYYSRKQLCGPDKSGAALTDWDGDGFCGVGQTLTDMAVSKNGELVAGYGEWNINVDSFAATGRVAVVPLNLKTKSWGAPVYAGSEALDVIRRLSNGDIAAPATDPSDRPAAGMSRGGSGGFVTNRGGTWRFTPDNAPWVHAFDVQQDAAGGLWMFGAAVDPKAHALARRSTNGGSSWSDARKDYSPGSETRWERYYWGAAVGNTVYTEPTGITSPGRYGSTLMYNNGSWTVLSSSEYTSQPRTIETLGKYKIRARYGDVSFNDGSGLKTMALPDRQKPKDLYVTDDGYLYVLGENIIVRTKAPAAEFEIVGKPEPGVADDLRSLAVYDDRLYFGGTSGTVYQAQMSITDAVRTSAGLGVEKDIDDAAKLLAAERVRTDGVAKLEAERADTLLRQGMAAAAQRETEELRRFDDTLANRETARAIILVNRSGVTVSRMTYERTRLLRIWNAELSRHTRLTSNELARERRRAADELTRSQSIEDAEKEHAKTLPSIQSALLERAAADRLVRDARIKADSADMLQRIQADGDAMKQRVTEQRNYVITANQQADRATYIDNREAKRYNYIRNREEKRAKTLASRGLTAQQKAAERARMVRIVTSEVARSGRIAASEVTRSQQLGEGAVMVSLSLSVKDEELAQKEKDSARRGEMLSRVAKDQSIRNERIKVDQQEREKRIRASEASRDASINSLLKLTPG